MKAVQMEGTQSLELGTLDMDVLELGIDMGYWLA